MNEIPSLKAENFKWEKFTKIFEYGEFRGVDKIFCITDKKDIID